MSKGSVEWSADLERIMALPRRVKPNLAILAAGMTAYLRKPEGTQCLRGIQAWALAEMVQCNGLLAPVSVGGGKTILGLLAPMVMPNCKCAVLLVPPSLRAQLLLRDWDFYDKHWNLPTLGGSGHKNMHRDGRPVLHVVAYSELSSPKSTVLLNQLNPDLILADECHRLKSYMSARGSRFINYFETHPDTRFCGWSGTITTKSIKDYAHLLQIALDLGSPAPHESSEVEKWSMALDPSEYHFEPGELSKLCLPGENVRSGYRRRLVDTPGVVASGGSELGTSLVFYERKAPPIPDEVTQHLRNLRRAPEMGGWRRPDDEELPDILRVQACARELAQGMYMRWRFPKNEPLSVRAHWFARRQEFNRDLREKLKHPAPHLDSPLLCIKAAIRWYDGGCPECHRKAKEPHADDCAGAESRPLWNSYCWPAWRDAKDTVVHESEVVWVSDYLMKDATEWAKEKPGIVWVEHPAVGEMISKLSGFRYYGGGDQASIDILKEDGKRSIICSIRARSEGLNLQHAFWRNLFVAPPADNGLIEQAVGRTHRPGQVEDEVVSEYYGHTSEMSDALDKARSRAEYVQQTTGSAQKLMCATWVTGEAAIAAHKAMKADRHSRKGK
jgi:hypothetical protein